MSSFTKYFDSKVNESFFRFVAKNIKDLFLYRFAIANFVTTSLRMRYRRSALGFLWSLLNPLMVMTVISLVFSVIFKRDVRTFGIYIFSGLAPWGFINQAVQNGAQSLIQSEGYLKKVYLPKVMFPIISVTIETVNFFFSLVSLYILALLLGSEITWRLLLLPVVLLLTFFFVLGIVIILSVATVYFRDLTQIVSVLFTALFYTVPIVYPVDLIPKEYEPFFLINPFYYYIMLFRKVIYYNHQPMTLQDWLIPAVISLVVVVIGIYILMKRNNDIIYRL